MTVTRSSFDHLEDGTAEAHWADAGLDLLAPVLASAERLVVLAAHPDDESLGAGGLLAASARLGAEITVVVATDGEASHPNSASYSRAELARLRRAEVQRAVERVAPRATVHHLGLPDGELRSHATALDAALGTLIGPGPVRLVTPWCGDRHPDHEACAEAGMRTAADHEIEHWQYPIWLWHWGSADSSAVPHDRLRRLELTSDALAAKRLALAEHVSQHEPLSDRAGDEPVLSAAMLAHFDRPYECFVVDPAPATRPEYFDALYAADPDPWGLGERFYEQRKRRLLIASLPRLHFRRAFEPGCATGELTAALLECCAEVVAWDVAAAAVRQATARFVDAPVRVERGQIPHDWPIGTFDLIVLSEVGYYCENLDALVARVMGSLAEDGVVVGCHWTHPAVDHPHTATAVHDAFDRVLSRSVHHEEPDFRLDVWSRDSRSVAATEGIL